MKLLFATDLSEPASVTQTVEQMADRLEAELLVLHVMVPRSEAADPTEHMPAATDPVTSAGNFTPYAPYEPSLSESLEEAEEHAFRQFLAERFSRPVRPAVRRGDPTQTILEDADEQDVDLLIMGKHRRGRLEGMLLGSTTKDVLRKSTRPTLLIPMTSKEE